YISDWGFRIADWGLEISDLRVPNLFFALRNPHFHLPKSERRWTEIQIPKSQTPARRIYSARNQPFVPCGWSVPNWNRRPFPRQCRTWGVRWQGIVQNLLFPPNLQWQRTKRLPPPSSDAARQARGAALWRKCRK